MTPSSMAATPGTASLAALIPIEDRGHHELLRLAAALGAYLRSEVAAALARAASAEGIIPPTVGVVIAQDPAQGVLARVEGRHLALGSHTYLTMLGLAPKRAETHAAAGLEASGVEVLYLVCVDDAHCIGLLGIARASPAAP